MKTDRNIGGGLEHPGALGARGASWREVKRRFGRLGGVLLLGLILRVPVDAGEASATSPGPGKPSLSDLSLSDFFSKGWDETWTRRSRGDGTPDMSFFRVQTNFLAQLFRADYVHTQSLDTASIRASDSLSTTVEYAFNRRFMLAVVENYRWLDSRIGEDRESAATAMFARFQLRETATSSLAANLRVGLPNRDIGDKDMLVSLSLAGWQDLAPLGLKRTGLYYHVQEETLAGRAKPGARRNDLTYDVTLARTWSSPESFFGNATTFLELYGITDLNGDLRGRSVLSVTPGVRATLAHRHIVMAGVEFPLTDPKTFDHTVRLTYIYNF